MKRGSILVLVAVLVFSVLLARPGSAIPPLPHEFYGIAVIGNEYAPAGTVIEVLDSGGAVCGSFTLKEPGFYGYLSCRGDDPSTPADEGPAPGEAVIFAVNGQEVNTSRIAWRSGLFTEVNLLLGPEEGLSLIQRPARVTADIGITLDRMLLFVMLLTAATAGAAWVMTRQQEG